MSFHKRGLELDFGCLFGSFFRFEVGTFLESEDARKDVFREPADGGVVFACRLVELTPFYADAVFRTF